MKMKHTRFKDKMLGDVLFFRDKILTTYRLGISVFIWYKSDAKVAANAKAKIMGSSKNKKFLFLGFLNFLFLGKKSLCCFPIQKWH